MTAVQEAPTYLEGLGPASTCQAYPGDHRPKALRHVWHHILPQSCGGQTVSANLAELCDTCHYAIHALLYALKLADGDETAAWPRYVGTVGQRALARQGYAAAVAAGTTDNIPDEGLPRP